MSPAELAAIRARVEAASPGPWRGDCESGSVRRAVLDAAGALVVYGSDHGGDPYYGIHEPEGQDYEPNAALIVNAPTDLAALLAEVARLTAEVERLSAMVPRWVPRQMTEEATVWTLRCGGALVAGSGVSTLAGVPIVMETHATLVHQDLPTACAAVCRRLGLPDILPPTENT